MPNPFDFNEMPDPRDEPSSRPAFPSQGAPIEPTRLESVEEIDKLLQGFGADSAARTPSRLAVPTPSPVSSESPHSAPGVSSQPTQQAAPYRPIVRPPMALLCVLDDGQDDGEWYRIRTEKFVIGRTDGDLVIPHDNLMSSRHAEIARSLENGAYRWKLNDLNSTNGLYVRVNSKAPVTHGQEMILGSRKYRFLLPAQGAMAPDASHPEGRTQGWQSVSPTEMIPSLVELTPQGEGQRFFLNPRENVIGRDQSLCNVVLGTDPLMSPRQLRLYPDKRGWQLENLNPVNGCWLRAARVNLGGGGRFQLGEQRFHFKLT